MPSGLPPFRAPRTSATAQLGQLRAIASIQEMEELRSRVGAMLQEFEHGDSCVPVNSTRSQRRVHATKMRTETRQPRGEFL